MESIESKDDQSNIEINQTINNTDIKPKRRRNRWDNDETINNQSSEIKENESNDKVELQDTKSNNNSETKQFIDNNINNSSNNINNDVKKPKKKRFAPAENTTTIIQPIVKEQPFILTPEVIQETLILKMKLQHITEKILTVAIDAMKIEQDPNRSPSPPPKYDANGKRYNTREQRMREALMNERTQIIEELIKINPSFIPPSDYVKPKPFRKLYVPIKEYPNYNFIGLIIGPRGNTQRQMETETGTKISIRGKGSINLKKSYPPADEDDDLHIHVQGETEENVEAAAKMIAKILTPVDDAQNEHKQKQLRELALINGTLRTEDFCPICGDKGHRQFECTVRIKNLKAAGVKCSICGELSHPTRDCPFKEDPQTNQVTIDSEYNSFIAELEGKKESNGDQTDTNTSTVSSNKDNTIATFTIGNKTQTVIQAPSMTDWNSGIGYSISPQVYYPSQIPIGQDLYGVPTPNMLVMNPDMHGVYMTPPLPGQPQMPMMPPMPMPYNYMGQPWFPPNA